jgi:hypothetical protein
VAAGASGAFLLRIGPVPCRKTGLFRQRGRKNCRSQAKLSKKGGLALENPDLRPFQTTDDRHRAARLSVLDVLQIRPGRKKVLT